MTTYLLSQNETRVELPSLPAEISTAVATFGGLHVDPVLVRTTGGGVPPVVVTPPVPTVPPGGPLICEMYERELFNKLIFSPRVIDLGFALSDQVVTVDAWNSSFTYAVMFSDVVSDDSTVTVLDDDSPSSMAPTTSRTFHIKVAAQGTASVNALVTFTFTNLLTGAPFTGTDVLLTALRMVVFTPPPNWDSGYQETRAYLTSIIQSFDGSEQRSQLRDIPSRTWNYTVSAVEPRDASFINSLLYGWQAQVFAVPHWLKAQNPNNDITAGNTTISVDTTDSEFEVGGLAIVWQDAFTWEASIIDSLTSGSITLNSPLAGNYDKDVVQVAPLKLARMGDTTTASHMTSEMTDVPVSFTLELQ